MLDRILFPNIDSLIYKSYLSTIIEYREYIDVIVLTDSKLETDSSYIDELKRLGIAVYSTVKNDYERLAKHLLEINQYKVVMPTHYDRFQHIYGFEKFSKDILYKKFNSVGLKTPKIYESNFKFPLIAKPINGSGGHGVKKIYDNDSLIRFINDKPYDYIDFGNGYQFEEFIEGPCISITCCKIKNEARFLVGYDIEYENNGHFIVYSRTSPTRFSELVTTNVLNNILEFVNKYVPDNGFMMIDTILKDNNFYAVDLGYRLPNTELSKHLFSKLLSDYLKFRIGTASDILSHTQPSLIQRYFDFENLTNSDVTKFNFVKEFVKPKKITKDVWNQKAMTDRGFVVIESKNPELDFQQLTKYMKRS